MVGAISPARGANGTDPAGHCQQEFRKYFRLIGRAIGVSYSSSLLPCDPMARFFQSIRGRQSSGFHPCRLFAWLSVRKRVSVFLLRQGGPPPCLDFARVRRTWPGGAYQGRRPAVGFELGPAGRVSLPLPPRPCGPVFCSLRPPWGRGALRRPSWPVLRGGVFDFGHRGHRGHRE